MKRAVSWILFYTLLVGVGVGNYMNLDKHYYFLQEFYDFPVPKDATLDSENTNGKGFTWGKSTGTEVPLSYRLMIIKSGWKQVKIDGHNVIYKKDDDLINLSLASKYIGVLKIKDTN
ncbi:hypothetical protein ACIQXF_14850 [Lysinibacillus sp. NPDC097231]|uniref:hypothetical protein n=1 Tax=Lysinibacillus sp. NPDC097231 TaxID=3364142 RepID=UPI0038030AB7